MKIYFYPYANLRDRQLDTMRNWPSNEIVSPKVSVNRRGVQVSADYAKASKLRKSWKSRIPLINLKFRPHKAPKDSVIYVWGAVVSSGNFIVDLDNPWSLTGFNLRTMYLYRPILRYILASSRCLEIRCMCESSRLSLKALFGQIVYEKASVHYPFIPQKVSTIPSNIPESCCFLFVGTQFEIKGGEALLKAFRRVYAKVPSARLDIVTHLPPEYMDLVNSCAGINVHKAKFTRDEIHEKFMRKADVLVLPTYAETFPMAAREGLSHGLAMIGTNVYGLREMVDDGRNGYLIEPPISVWDGVLPSQNFYDMKNFKKNIEKTDTTLFERQLENAILELATNPEFRLAARQASLRILKERFTC
jgi:glycosyltransferase involved in cell wall biosynthesis